MKLTVISATGGIGRALVEQAVAAGHDVTAVARNADRIGSEGSVRAVQADLADPSPTASAALSSAVAGSDAVLSGLGPRTRADVGIAEQGTRTLIRAMQAVDARRLVVVSAAPVSTTSAPDPGNGFWARHLLYPVIGRVLRGNYADLAEMERALAASGLQWTAVRPPRLTDGPLTRRYRSALDQNVRGGLSISRADVAHLMLDVAGRPETAGHTVGCGY
ncbi:hypothetical protein Kisp01_44700 [Kineosporia sp. NBRC 101677]|uniref:NAD(P)-dependent oxidoreductase n=1 Tax=Kineosporia sp. NBRC 101677 TaxID=3032197 RepID=UPI0024A0C3CD|nr:NAD(P)H-binding protein [Kineosporia sp. NBRC 101677]GLY17456.1 hypothetical protein Kisp01_44700 [Kineosporia sp. NBRC 101677]